MVSGQSGQDRGQQGVEIDRASLLSFHRSDEFQGFLNQLMELVYFLPDNANGLGQGFIPGVNPPLD